MTVYGRGLYRSQRFMVCGHRKIGRISHMAHVEDNILLASLPPQIGGANLLRSIDRSRLVSPRLACPFSTAAWDLRTGQNQNPIAARARIVHVTDPHVAIRHRSHVPMFTGNDEWAPPEILFLSFHPASHLSSIPDKPDVLISTPVHPSIHFVRPSVRTYPPYTILPWSLYYRRHEHYS